VGVIAVKAFFWAAWAVIFVATAEPCFAYSVKGVTLGDRVQFGSDDYKKYACSNSQPFYGNEFAGFTWCRKTEHEREKRGSFKAYYTILHSDDGSIVYVNRSQEPAYWGENEVKSDIDYYSGKIGARPKNLIKMPSRPGFPDGTIAVWGDVTLDRIVDPQSLKLLAAEKNPNLGVLIDFIGDYARSAKNDLPVYRMSGGAGFVWSASYNSHGRGTLRFLAINPSAFYVPALSAPNPQPPPPPQSRVPDTYSTIGFWTIKHRIVGTLDGCDATSEFRDQTIFQMALVQSSASDKEWLIFLSNPRWNGWISRKGQHTLRLTSTKEWKGKFAVNKSNALWIGNLSDDFMDSIADASSIEVLNDRNDPLTSLDMTDSTAAIKAVANCVREHPYAPAPQAREQPAPTPEPEATATSGTGFFVAPHFVVTNNHVVKECTKPIWVRYPERESFQAMIYRQDDANDLAVLHTELTSPSVASFRFKARLGERVATYGFPYSGILSSSGNFTLGDVTASAGMKDDTRFFQISTPIQPGNSGGPLLDMSGNVVGVVVSQLNAIIMMQFGNSVPQNVNFAIRSPIVTNFLGVKGVLPKIANSDAKGHELSPSDVADIASDFTVQVYCGVEVLADKVKCDFRYQELKLPPAEYESFKGQCMGQTSFRSH
jgi:serine protease Do